jgi:hypothetical protein
MWILEKQGSVVVGSSNKRHKQKDAHHAFKWKKLENPDIQAEMGWEMRRRSSGLQKCARNM